MLQFPLITFIFTPSFLWEVYMCTCLWYISMFSTIQKEMPAVSQPFKSLTSFWPSWTRSYFCPDCMRSMTWIGFSTCSPIHTWPIHCFTEVQHGREHLSPWKQPALSQLHHWKLIVHLSFSRPALFRGGINPLGLYRLRFTYSMVHYCILQSASVSRGAAHEKRCSCNT